jgi:hypothetical protein
VIGRITTPAELRSAQHTHPCLANLKRSTVVKAAGWHWIEVVATVTARTLTSIQRTHAPVNMVLIAVGAIAPRATPANLSAEPLGAGSAQPAMKALRICCNNAGNSLTAASIRLMPRTLDLHADRKPQRRGAARCEEDHGGCAGGARPGSPRPYSPPLRRCVPRRPASTSCCTAAARVGGVGVDPARLIRGQTQMPPAAHV